MNRSLPPFAFASLLAGLLLLAACGRESSEPDPARPVTPAPASTSAADNSPKSPTGNTHLTVYSGGYAALAGSGRRADDAGYALVRRQLRYELQEGGNSLAIGDLPRAIDVAAVTLQPTTPGTSVVAQRFIAPLGGDVLQRALGRRVAVEHTSGGAKQTDNGILVAIDDGLTLALSDGRYKLIREYDSLSLLDAGDLPAATPQLRWQVQAQQAGPATFRLDYPTGGLAWRAEYVARLAEGEDASCALALDGWAMVANQSGVPFRNVALTLVAGEPNLVRESSPAMYRRADTTMALAAPAPALPKRRTSGEYHAYELPGRTTLNNGAVERVPLFARAPKVACERIYLASPNTRVRPPPRPRTQPGFNQATGPQPVKTVVEVDNSKDAGLGQPLPAGRVRVFDGGDFLGESALPHTPEGAEISLETGTVFDLSAERERSDFDVNRSGRTMTESFVITLGNAKDSDVTVRVVEPLPRWSDWDIVASSVPAEKRDAQHAEFNVPVPAGGQTKLTYTVRYRWPADIKP